MKYQFFLAEEALSVFSSINTRERALLGTYFQHLAAFPENSDCSWDLGGFTFHAKRFGRWSITYRIDDAVNHLFILTIDKLTLG